jgi:capsular exopolysaccharide synthesis family protein
MIYRPATDEAESFRRLRANLEFANIDQQLKTIMVTSATPQEGKTTTAANLAVALARAGHTVALVDLDLRSPTVHRMFGLYSRPGLAQLALGEVSVDDALVPVPFEDGFALTTPNSNGEAMSQGTLLVLPVGSLPPNPGEFIASNAVGRILQEVGERADLVLVDAPPALVVSDAVSLSARVDAVLVVVRLNSTNRRTLAELGRTLATFPCAKLGYVLTNADSLGPYGVYGDTPPLIGVSTPPGVGTNFSRTGVISTLPAEGGRSTPRRRERPR